MNNDDDDNYEFCEYCQKMINLETLDCDFDENTAPSKCLRWIIIDAEGEEAQNNYWADCDDIIF